LEHVLQDLDLDVLGLQTGHGGGQHIGLTLVPNVEAQVAVPHSPARRGEPAVGSMVWISICIERH
jgi:hypothetical protein